MLSNNVLMLIYGVMFTIFGLGTGLVSLIIYQQLKERSVIKKSMTSNKDRVKAFKADGGMHKWVNIAVKMPNGVSENTHVCEHTGYCPKFDGFVSLSYVKDIINQRELEKEFQAYRSKMILDITERYNLPCGEVTRHLIEEVLSLKKNFHIDKMNKFKAEIKEKFGDKVTVISSMDELGDAIKEATNGKS